MSNGNAPDPKPGSFIDFAKQSALVQMKTENSPRVVTCTMQDSSIQQRVFANEAVMNQWLATEGRIQEITSVR